MIKNTSLKAIMFMLIAGTALVPQRADAMNWKKWQYSPTEEQLNDQLLSASVSGDSETIKNCINKGASIECKSYSNMTPLMFACRWGHTTCVRLLIAHGANIEVIDDDCWTPSIQYSPPDLKVPILPYLADIKREFIAFKKNPTKWPVAAPQIPKMTHSVFMKMLYKKCIYDIGGNSYTNLCSVFARLQKSNNSKKLKKIIDACNFLQYSQYSKKEIKKLENIGFPLTSDQLDMQINLIKNMTESTSFDIDFIYDKRKKNKYQEFFQEAKRKKLV